MIQEIAEKYIAELTRLYPISDKAADKLRDASDKINAELGCYHWTDVRDAIEKYFRTKSDKTRPTVAQIAGVLENTRGVRKIEQESDEPRYRLPRSNLWAISRTFDAVIRTMVQCKILEPENPLDTPLAPGYSLLDTDDLPMLNPRARLKMLVGAAKNQRPDVFAPYGRLSFWEELAIAVQNGLITLRVQDWHEFYAGLPGEIKSVIANRVPGATTAVNDMVARWSGRSTVGIMEVR